MDESPRLERLTTGIARLDYILKGGLPRRGLYVLYGAAGSGKTLAANQVCFHNARAHGGRCVYFTLAVESHAKMLEHLGTLSFFEPERVGESIFYVSGYSVLREEGITGLLEFLRRTLEARDANFAVIDGLANVLDLAGSPQRFREFLHVLQTYAMLLDCTVLLVSTIAEHEYTHVLADGLIELSYDIVGPRMFREVVVYKLRGSDFLPGRHQAEITSDGMVVHPRTEVQFAAPPAAAHEAGRERMAFGVGGLDAMLNGGIPSGSATGIVGGPGVGKTTLGMAFLLEGAHRGQPSYYFGFHETPPRLMEHLRSVGMDIGPLVEAGTLDIRWLPPLEHFLDALAEGILEPLRRGPARPRRRLVIDSLDAFWVAAVYPERMARFLSAFTHQLRVMDVTTLITKEEVRDPMERGVSLGVGLNASAETLIRLAKSRRQGVERRWVAVEKMRESAYDASIHAFRITERGFEVDPKPLSGPNGASGRPAGNRGRP